MQCRQPDTFQNTNNAEFFVTIKDPQKLIHIHISKSNSLTIWFLHCEHMQTCATHN